MNKSDFIASDDIYKCTSMFSCKEIKLFAWNGKETKPTLILFTGNGDFVYHNMDMEKAIIKQIAWFKDPAHYPVSICFSPSGCFVLAVSHLSHLYIVPVCSESPCTFQCDRVLNVIDLTIHPYPFMWNKNCKFSTDVLTLPVRLLHEKDERKDLKQNLNENELILKEIMSVKSEKSACSVCWWHTPLTFREIGLIGTESGEILFVDLASGIKVKETSVKRPIKTLCVCQDSFKESGFLLITVDNNDQYKLALDEKFLDPPVGFFEAGLKKECRDDGEGGPSKQGSQQPSVSGDSGSPSSRTRLQSLKQMSAVKLASLKHKIAETRSKISVKQEIQGEGESRGLEAQSIGSIVGETFLSPQRWNGEIVLAGYFDRSQLLTIHSENLELVPRSVHKLPPETGSVLLCNGVICVVSKEKRSVQLISSKLTETRIDEPADFNADAVLGRWRFGRSSADESEIILGVYKFHSNDQELNDVGNIYNIEAPREGFSELSLLRENCVVITDRSVRIIHLKANLLKIVLDLILEAHELEKAERICTIFGINLQKLLELAGDVKLKALEFPTAIALYKLSKCGPLKSIVKLACGSHCLQVLNYALMLMSSSTSEMPLTEKIHLSNLIIMTYTQQTLKAENNRKILEKFIEFIQTNCYFDEVLAVSVTGQSLIFACLKILIAEKGLILEGYNVLIKLMERFSNSKALDWSLKKEDFWNCATEPALTEAIVFESSSFSTYSKYVWNHLDELSPANLKRLSAMLDPTAACLRPLARIHHNSRIFFSDAESTQSIFPFGKLVELFLVTLLAKAHKTERTPTNRYETFLWISKREKTSDFSETTEPINDQKNETNEIPILKACDGESWRKSEKRLSCGFGHVALIRNGTVYTWGQTAKGCVGQGSTMMRHALPGPVSWLNSFKLQVSMVACGKNHTAALTNNGVYTWGCSKYGQLGLGNVEKCPHPRLVTALANETIIFISCGQFHTVALTSRGTVFSWGWGVHGQLGLGTIDDHRVPQFVYTLKEHVIVDVAAGHGHTLVLSDKGRVYAFGSSVFGQLGTGDTAKHSSPVLVKGFDGKVSAIATGYFHNLAVTEFNKLYTWGLSPQCLRFQAQTRKKSKLLHGELCGENTGRSSDATRDEWNGAPRGTPDQHTRSEKENSESHLSPSLVDTSNVKGNIFQISCGCHHSALITVSGDLYTWGRSLDGQLGTGGHREVQNPTRIGEETLKVEEISCGCEFTVAQEKQTGRIYAWGSNSVGQLAQPVKESATKSLDGKLVMLKSCKRIVRLLDRNANSNSSDVPKEISEIPPPTFTYRSLSKHADNLIPNLSILDPEYSEKSLRVTVENFSRCIDLNLVLNKSLEYENFQVASEIAFFQGNYKQSMVYQLKELQTLHKSRGQSPSYSAVVVRERQPDSKNIKSERVSSTSPTDELKSELAELAKSIIKSYLDLRHEKTCDKNYVSSVLETGIHFWMAERLDPTSLELFFYDNLNEIFYDLAHHLFCVRKENVTASFRFFSTKFLIELIRKVLNLVEENKSHAEYVETISKILGLRENEKKEFQKPEWLLESIETKLRNSSAKEDFLRIPGGILSSNNVYFFTCGHNHSHASLNEEFLLFEKDPGFRTTSNFILFYQGMSSNGRTDSACPKCVKSDATP